MRSSVVLIVTLFFASVLSPSLVAAQSLADAAKKAKEAHEKGMGWPAPAAPKEVAPGATTPTPAPTSEDSASVASTTESGGAQTTSTTKDETYWKNRMRAVTSKLADDQALLDAAETSEQALDTRLNKSRDNADYVRDRAQRAVLENQWQDALKERNRLKAVVTSDKRTKTNLEEEARKAGVPPKWLVIE
jgi:hypothetical protein